MIYSIVKWAFVFFAPRIVFTFLKVFETLALPFTNTPRYFLPTSIPCSFSFSPSQLIQTHGKTKRIICYNGGWHIAICQKRSEHEVVQALVSIDSISSFKLRLNQPNKPSSRITPFQPLYRILKLGETGDKEQASKIHFLEKECKENISMATEGSNILKMHLYFPTDEGFAIILSSCRFSLFVLRNYRTFRNEFEEFIAAVHECHTNFLIFL